MNRRLYRSYDDRVLAGVAGGIAETYDFDPALVRVAWVLLILLTGGVFLIVYIAMALVVPLAPDDVAAGWPAGQPAPGDVTPAPGGAGDTTTYAAAGQGGEPFMSERERRRRARLERGGAGRSDIGGALALGLILILVGGFFLLREYIPQIAWGQLWPLALIAVGGLFLLGAFRRTSR